MKNIHTIEFRDGSKEEVLPDFAPDFPHIASHVAIEKFTNRFVPWHWHKEIELFYMEYGSLEYHTPKGVTLFPPGSGGLLNSNVLHMTRLPEGVPKNSSFLHLFDTSLLSGQPGSRIEQNYITPLISAPQVELIALSPDVPKEAALLSQIQASFLILPEEYGYEMKLRAALSEIWCQFLALVKPRLDCGGGHERINDKLKLMMIFIHDHFPEKISVSEIAAAAYISERECFRAFHDCLHTTPAEYVKSYRLQHACHMLASGNESVTTICHACGLGSSSYFGKVFRDEVGCTPLEYRRRMNTYNMAE